MPKTKNERWPRNPIDQFVLAKIEQRKLSPSPEADRRTLLRRLSIDLTGLPPTPDELDQFLADQNPRAYEKQVDRLLASPRYGERWARHWLDVIHFGETHGYDKDKPRPNAWPYRDYVIRAFNDDIPYSKFVEEQLAADVLFPDEPDKIAALGFIAAGPWDFVGHVELPIEKTDGLIARYNDRDDMVMTTISTFQSLTVHCARCHNHKFDPITQKDYYRLQAVFAGVDRADRAYDRDLKVRDQRRTLRQERRSLEDRLLALTNQISRIATPELRELDRELKAATAKLALPAAGSAGKSPGNGYHSAIEKTQDTSKWVQVDLGQSQTIDEIRLIPARPVDFPDTPGFGFPLRFRVEISADPAFKQSTILADLGAGDLANPGEDPFKIAVNAQKGKFVRVTATKLWKRTDDFVFALAELEVFSGGTNVAYRAPVSALDSIEAGLWSKKFLVDGYTSRSKLENPSRPQAGEEKGRELKTIVFDLETKRRNVADSLIDQKTKSELADVREHLDEINRQLSLLPAEQKVYAAANSFTPNGSFFAAKTPRPVHLLSRGDVKQPGDLMNAGSIAAVPGPPAEFKISDPDDEGSRRAALAKWITDPRNMLTRRSIVNRIWHFHFGRGIVETPNDFGHMGAGPTHPELLDWLANWFLENGESLKALHRLIVTSSTYRQSSASRLEFAKVDADNRYLWRMNPSRLDAESVRDTMLFVSGKLDFKMGGPSVQQFHFKDDHSPVYDYTPFNVDSPGSHRRSIYRFIVRSVPDPLMDALDCPDASILTPKRNITMTALQALAVLNNPFVLKQSEHLAARVARSGNLEKQIQETYRLTLLRAPTAEELKKLIPFAREHGMVNLCRLVFNTSEFLFVD